jgi:hypothetical protein
LIPRPLKRQVQQVIKGRNALIAADEARHHP